MNEEQALKILKGGSRRLDSNFLKLDRRMEDKGCLDPSFSSDTAMVKMVGLPVYLWCIDLFQKVGSLYEGFVNVICSLHDMSKVRILVRKGEDAHVSIVVDNDEPECRIWQSRQQVASKSFSAP